MGTTIHPTAIVEPGAQLGMDCEIQAYALITKHAQLGDRVVVYPHAVIGGDPQYLKFDRATPAGVRVGAGTVVRESATINRSCKAGEATIVGEGCFLMASSHIGHDCILGNQVILANNVLLGGHVSVGDFTFIGGGAGVHQFVRIGGGTMVGGLSRISLDVPPFALVAERDEISGLNVVGLRRRGFSRETIRELKDAYREIYYTPGNIRSVAVKVLESGRFGTPDGKAFVDFFTGGKRGFARPHRPLNEGESDE